MASELPVVTPRIFSNRSWTSEKRGGVSNAELGIRLKASLKQSVHYEQCTDHARIIALRATTYTTVLSSVSTVCTRLATFLVVLSASDM